MSNNDFSSGVNEGARPTGEAGFTADPPADDKKADRVRPKASNKTLAMVLLDEVPWRLATLAYRDRDREFIKEAAAELVVTLMAINALDEYATFIRVAGCPVPFSDYTPWKGFNSFIAPKKLHVTESLEEIDLIRRSEFRMQGDVLNAEEFNRVQAEMLRKMVRFQKDTASLERSDVQIAEGIKWAATRNAVRTVNQSKVMPLSVGLIYPESYQVSITRWLDQWLTSSAKLEG